MRLAFSGISGSGKDFLANYLIKEKGYTRVSFSDQLKKIAKYAFPWLEIDYAPIVKEEPLNIIKKNGKMISLSPREIWLQFDSLRQIDEYVFIRGVEEELEYISGDVIISDIRTKEEFDFCKENGFYIIHISPEKHIYERNSFDNFCHSNKAMCDYIFENDFNGISKFENFLRKGIK